MREVLVVAGRVPAAWVGLGLGLGLTANPHPKPKPKPKPNLTLSLTTGQVALVAQALDLLAAPGVGPVHGVLLRRELEPVGGIISGAGRELLRCAAASRPDRLEVVVEG